MNNMIDNFVNDVCLILKISTPTISYDTSVFTTDTMMACVKSDGSIIHIKSMDKPSLDLMFAIAHELRHVWQFKNRPEMLNGYQTSDKLSVSEYNAQEAEIDANAFGLVVMDDLFGVEPRFDNLPEDLRHKIKKHAKSISI